MRDTVSSGRIEARLAWDPLVWEDHMYWQATDSRILKWINTLVSICLRDPFSGIGKPEQPKYGAARAWSRRITEEYRFVYLVNGGDPMILQTRYHYRGQHLEIGATSAAWVTQAGPPNSLGKS